MRPVHLADIETAARVLMLLAPDARAAAMQAMIGQTEAADHYRQANDRPHPRFGMGTLMSSALRWHVAPRPAALGSDALHAYCAVLKALRDHAAHHAS